MKKLLFTSIYVCLLICVNAQYKGIQVTSNTSAVSWNYPQLPAGDTINFWYYGNVQYNAVTQIASVSLQPRYAGVQLDATQINYPAPANGSFTVTWSAPTGISGTSIQTQLKAYFTSLGLNATVF